MKRRKIVSLAVTGLGGRLGSGSDFGSVLRKLEHKKSFFPVDKEKTLRECRYKHFCRLPVKRRSAANFSGLYFEKKEDFWGKERISACCRLTSFRNGLTSRRIHNGKTSNSFA